jgi:aminopeptidase N
MILLRPVVAGLLFASVLCHAQESGRKERSIDVLHYRIEARPLPADGILFGACEISFRALRPGLDSIRLDAVGISIDSVSAGLRKASGYVSDSAELGIRLPKPMAMNDTTTVRIVYHCRPYNGMFFVKHGTPPEESWQIWTQGQPDFNRCWFPCNDVPGDKATSEVLLTVDSALSAISNGVLLSRSVNTGGTVTWHWSQDKPHSPYLIMLAAGDYQRTMDSTSGTPIVSYRYPQHSAGDGARAFGSTPAMLKFYERWLDFGYPWPIYSQLPVSHFIFGGMENTTATVLNDGMVLFDRRASVDHSGEALVAHELAHQWWGDLVTCAGWGDIWLNEGFATYFQQLWTMHSQGRDEFDLQRLQGIRNYIRWADEHEGAGLAGADGNDAPNTYGKGAAVLHMLRVAMGDSLFQMALRKLLVSHAYGTVCSEDLRSALEQTAGVSLKSFFGQWVYDGGYPVLNVSYQWDENRHGVLVNIEQCRRRGPGARLYGMDMQVDLVSGTRTDRRVVRIDDSVTVCFLPTTAPPDMVVFDPSRVLLGVVTVHASAREWCDILEYSPDVPARMEAVSSLLDIGLKDTVVRRALMRAAVFDPFHGVRSEIAAHLAAAVTDDCLFKNELRYTLLELLKDRWPAVRAHACNGLGRFRDTSLIPVFRSLLADSSYYVEAAAMNGMLGVDSSGSANVVLQRLRAGSYHDVLRSSALDWVIRYSMKVATSELEALAGPEMGLDVRIKALRAMADRGQAESLWKVLTAMLEENSGDARILAASALISLFSKNAIPVVSRRLDRETDPRVRTMFREMLSGTNRGR